MAQNKYDFTPALENTSNVHRIELDLIDEGSYVLDVGCHSGLFAAEATARKHATVVGLDTDEDALNVARTRMSAALAVDIEQQGWTSELINSGHGPFDRIIFGDVLEHTHEPEMILTEAKKLLRPGGRIIVSIPNVAHWRVRLGLLRGKFTYTESGILDRTHLRFYTLATGREMIERCGYRILTQDVAGYSLPHILIRSFPTLLAIQQVYSAVAV